MSREFNDIIREVIKSNKELHKVDDRISKEIGELDREIQGLKKDVKSLSNKLDDVLEILNTLTIFIEDAESILDEDDGEEEYQSNEGWLPEVNNWEENRDDDDEEDI